MTVQVFWGSCCHCTEGPVGQLRGSRRHEVGRRHSGLLGPAAAPVVPHSVGQPLAGGGSPSPHGAAHWPHDRHCGAAPWSRQGGRCSAAGPAGDAALDPWPVVVSCCTPRADDGSCYGSSTGWTGRLNAVPSCSTAGVRYCSCFWCCASYRLSRSSLGSSATQLYCSSCFCWWCGASNQQQSNPAVQPAAAAAAVPPVGEAVLANQQPTAEEGAHPGTQLPTAAYKYFASLGNG